MIHQFQARLLESARRGGHRYQREPPRDDPGLQFMLEPEDIVPAPPAREEPPEEEPEPSLDFEVDESWPGSSQGGRSVSKPTKRGHEASDEHACVQEATFAPLHLEE